MLVGPLLAGGDPAEGELGVVGGVLVPVLVPAEGGGLMLGTLSSATGGGVGVDVLMFFFFGTLERPSDVVVFFFFALFKKIPTAAAEAQMMTTIDVATMIFALRERRFAPMVMFPVSCRMRDTALLADFL
jgi:hypothetical protein